MLATFQTLRPKLFAIAYRMLGSASEAEDLLQEAWLRFQTVDAASIRSAEALLTTIVTRLALDHLKSAQVQREQYPGIWLPEPVGTPDQELRGDPLDEVLKRESISVAFLHLLENLSPEERVVFLLREVFEYDYKSIADFLDKRESACRQLFHRAKEHITAHRPRFPTSIEEHERVFGQFVHATQTGDLEGLMVLMIKDVVIYSDGGGKASALARPLYGPAAAARFFISLAQMIPKGFGYTAEIVPLNGRSSIIVRNKSGAIETTISLDVAEGKILAFHVMRNPDKLGQLS
jgi:RNA polymerase sigma-70 factor (ECF subfamily)